MAAWLPKGEIFLTQKELRREEVIQKLIDDKISVNHAMQVLDLSKRHILRLKSGYIENGSLALIHGNRNRIPVHTIDEDTKERVVDIVREKYLGNSYRYIRQMLEKEYGIIISTTSIARILNSYGLSNGTKKRKVQAKSRKIEVPAGKSMVSISQRQYKWFADTTKQTVLTATVDLLSGKIIAMMMSDAFDELDYLDVMRKVITTAGVPHVVYCEDKSVIVESKNLTIEDELAGRQYHPTSLGEALEKLNVSIMFGTNDSINKKSDSIWQLMQLRLSKILDSKGVNNIRDFNKFSVLFVRLYNESINEPNDKDPDYMKPLTVEEAEVLLSPREKFEVVGNSMIYHDGKLFRITAPNGKPAGIRQGNKVTVHTLLNKNKEIVSYRGALFELREMNTLAGVKR